MKALLKSFFLKKFIIHIEAFIIFSVVITLLSIISPERCYNYKNWMFKERTWEKHGKLYQERFKVKIWKNHLPELADFIKFIFPKKSIKDFRIETILKYMRESCKAEFAHWCIILSSVVFLFYDGIPTFIYMLLIAAALNLPFIIIQRYNRPRIKLIMKNKGIMI